MGLIFHYSVDDEAGKSGCYTIQRSAEDLAARLLQLVCGRPVPFGRLAAEIADRPEVQVFLAEKIVPSHPVWTGIAKASNLAAYLSKALVDMVRKYDSDLAEDEAESGADDDL